MRYVYRDGEPLAQIAAPNTPTETGNAGAQERITYLEIDHLGTPRVGTDAQARVVWRWDSDAFGTTAANEDPGNTGTRTVVNLRFPGQYFDRESGLHYNWARYYDASMGRYSQSDSTGLAGGINTYSYAIGNPMSFVDPSGLDATVCLYPASGPYGHVGIGINTPSTVGLYPRSEAPGWRGLTGTPAEVKPDINKAEQCKTINTTPDQDKKMAEFIERTTANPGTYRFTGNNCTNFVRSVLEQAGISTPSSPGPRPYFAALPGTP